MPRDPIRTKFEEQSIYHLAHHCRWACEKSHEYEYHLFAKPITVIKSSTLLVLQDFMPNIGQNTKTSKFRRNVETVYFRSHHQSIFLSALNPTVSCLRQIPNRMLSFALRSSERLPLFPGLVHKVILVFCIESSRLTSDEDR